MDYTNICICTSGGMVSVTSLSTTHRILCFLIFLLCFLKLCHGIQTETLHDSSREYDLDTATGNTFSKGNTENTRHRPNVGPTLGQRGRWCFNTGPTLGQCLVYAGKHGRIFHCVKYSAGNPENTRHRPNVGPTLGQRRRWCTNTGPTLGRCLVNAGEHGRIFRCAKYSAAVRKGHAVNAQSNQDKIWHTKALKGRVRRGVVPSWFMDEITVTSALCLQNNQSSAMTADEVRVYAMPRHRLKIALRGCMPGGVFLNSNIRNIINSYPTTHTDNEVEFLSTTKSTLLMKMEQMVPKYPQILLKNVVKVVLSDSTENDRETIRSTKRDVICELQNLLPFVEKDVITRVINKLANSTHVINERGKAGLSITRIVEKIPTTDEDQVFIEKHSLVNKLSNLCPSGTLLIGYISAMVGSLPPHMFEGTDRTTIHGSRKDLIFELHSRLPFVQKDVITQVVSKLATDMAVIKEGRKNGVSVLPPIINKIPTADVDRVFIQKSHLVDELVNSSPAGTFLIGYITAMVDSIPDHTFDTFPVTTAVPTTSDQTMDNIQHTTYMSTVMTHTPTSSTPVSAVP